MTFLLILPTLLCFLLLGAHFLHQRSMLVVAGWIGMAVLLIVPRHWIPRIVQVILVLAAVEWIRTTLKLIDERIARGEHWHRLAVIMFGVALFNLVAAAMLQARRVRARYSTSIPVENDPTKT